MPNILSKSRTKSCGNHCLSLAVAFVTVLSLGLVGASAQTVRLSQTIALSSAGLAVTATPATLSFGSESTEKTSAAKVVTLKNDQSAPLTIASITTGLPIFSITTTCPIGPATLAANSTCTVSVSFGPSVAGSFTDTLTVADNASNSPTVSLAGIGIIPVMVNPATLSFGNQLNGTTSAAMSVTLINNQGGTLNISAITSSLPDFAVSSTTCPISPNLLAGGASCTASVTFTPSLAGSRTGILSFKGNATNSPQKVTLNGTGLAPGPVSIAVTPSPTSVALGKTKQFIATGTYSDGSKKNVTSSITWASSTPATASINASGLATGVSKGLATITASLGAISGAGQLTVTPAVLTSIAVTPSTVSLPAGQTQQLTATGIYSDNSTQNLTSSVAWSSSAPSIASVNTAGLASALGGGTATVTATSGSLFGTATVAVPALVSIAVTPAASSFAGGTTQKLKATGTYTDGSTLDLTSSVSWSTGNANVAMVNSAGLVSGSSAGSSSIVATAGSVSGSTTVNITPATMVSITVTPVLLSIPAGISRHLAATGTFSDNSTQNLTDTVQWNSDTPAVAQVSNLSGSQGLVTSNGAGAATISASLGGIAGTTVLTVTSAALVSITIAPDNASIALGTTQQFKVTGSFTDNSTRDISGNVTWSSDTPATATINSAGLASGAGSGTTTISAASGGISASITLTVTPAVLTSIAINPPTASIAPGTTQTFTAAGTYSDGTTQDVTQLGYWTSSNAAVATVSDSAPNRGAAATVGAGSTTISVSAGGVTASSARLVVTSAALVSIAITPQSPSITLGNTQQFTATGTYSDGTVQNLTSIAQWSSSSNSVAIISTTGLATSSGAGGAIITAGVGSITNTLSISVIMPSLVSIAVAPTNVSIPLGFPQPLTAIGTYADGSVRDLTNSVTWASSDPTVARVSTQGLVLSVAAGGVNISVTSGSIIGSTGLTVTSATLVSIGVSPSAASIALGATQQFAATGTYTDGSTETVTGSVLWSSSAPAVAAINSGGLATSASIGGTNLTASIGSITGEASLMIQQPPLSAISISPASPSLALGATQQLQAIGTYGGSTQDITNSVNWGEANNAVVAVNASGIAAGLGIGTTTVTATSGSIVSSAPISVTLGPVPATFFGMQFASPTSTVSVPYGTCRIWGAPGTLWADIEPSQGVFQFTTLDGILATAKKAGINDGCVFTFGYFPQWASINPTDNTCEKLNSTTGSCWPPADLNYDGTGTDQTVVDAITAIATHLNDPVYLQTHSHIRYWEPFDEPYRSSTLTGTICTTSHACSYNGSYAQLVRMTEDMRCIIKGVGTVNGVPCTSTAIDPTASITTPSGQSYFQTNGRLLVANFLQCNQTPLSGSGCTTGSRGSAAVDVVNLHCYIFTGNPDDATANIAASRALLTPTDAAKPFICGEGSWGIPSELTDPDLQAGFVARWFTDILNQQVTFSMWYSWDNQGWGTLWNPKGKNGCTQAAGCMNEAGTAYGQTYNWLAGNTLQGCQNSGGVNACTITGPGGYSALMVWATTSMTSCVGQLNAEVCGNTLYQVPAGYITKHYLDGSSQPASATEFIGAKPLLLANQ